MKPDIHKIVTTADGAPYLPVLTRKLLGLETQLGEGAYISQSYSFPCGIRGRIQSNPHYRRIEIWQEPMEVLNGMVHTGYIADRIYKNSEEHPNIIKLDGPSFEYFYTGTLENGYDVAAPALQPGESYTEYAMAFYPSETQAGNDGTGRQWEGRTELAVSPYDSYGTWGRFKPSECSKTRGCEFSGEMRKFVQMLLGAGEQIPYQHNFYTVHGIWTGSDDSKWLIEIDWLRGVLAMPLTVCRAAAVTNARLKSQLGYMPVLEMFPSRAPQEPTEENPSGKSLLDLAIEKGDVIQVGPADIMKDYYATKFPYGGIGFAFSYDGHEAQNVVWQYSAQIGTAYRTNYRYKVSILGGTAPLSASIAVVSSGVLCGGGNFFPTIKVPGGLGMYTVDMNVYNVTEGADGKTWNPGGAYVECIDTPVHVFYTEAGEELVTFSFLWKGPRMAYDYKVRGASGLPSNWADWGNEIKETEQISDEVYGGFTCSASSPVTVYKQSVVSSYSYTRGEDLGSYKARWTDYGPYNSSLVDVAGWSSVSKPGREIREFKNQTLLIPYGDRECYYHLTGVSNYEGEKNTTYAVGLMSVRQWAGVMDPWYVTCHAYDAVGDWVGPQVAGGAISGPCGPRSWSFEENIPLGATRYTAPDWTWSTLEPAVSNQNWYWKCFVAGDVQTLTFPPFYAAVPYSVQPFFDVWENGYYMYVYSSAFNDKPTWIANNSFNAFMSKDCTYQGDYPFNNPLINSTGINFVGLT